MCPISQWYFNMSLCEIVKSWPKTWATCPVYRKVTTPSGELLEGKPLGRAHKNDLAHASLHYCEQHPNHGAIGVFTGARSGGLLILDVDMQLANLKRKYPGDFDGPRVISPKENAGKFLFLLPEEDWAHVSDVSRLCPMRLGGSVGSYGRPRVLTRWRGIWLKGEMRTFRGSCVAARMRLRKEEKDQVSASKAKKNIFDPTVQTEEVRHAIVQECLNVFPLKAGDPTIFGGASAR